MDNIGPLDLPDSVWLKILCYLSADNLLPWTNLTEKERNDFLLANRLFHLCGDKELWRQIKWNGGKVKPFVLRKIVKFLGPHTEKIWSVLHNLVYSHMKIKIGYLGNLIFYSRFSILLLKYW